MKPNILDLEDDWKQELSKTFKMNKADNAIRCRGCDRLLGGYIGTSIILFDVTVDDNDYSICQPCGRNEKIDEVLYGK